MRVEKCITKAVQSDSTYTAPDCGIRLIKERIERELSGYRMNIIVPITQTLKTKRCRLRYPDRKAIQHIWSVSRNEGLNDGMVWYAP